MKKDGESNDEFWDGIDNIPVPAREDKNKVLSDCEADEYKPVPAREDKNKVLSDCEAVEYEPDPDPELEQFETDEYEPPSPRKKKKRKKLREYTDEEFSQLTFKMPSCNQTIVCTEGAIIERGFEATFSYAFNNCKGNRHDITKTFFAQTQTIEQGREVVRQRLIKSYPNLIISSIIRES